MYDLGCPCVLSCDQVAIDTKGDRSLQTTIDLNQKQETAGGCIIPSPKEEEPPMSEDALRGWYWTGIAAFALVILVIWYMEVVR